jgi:hypothetical protein
MLPAKISVTIKLIMDKNGITQLWTVKCWGPTTVLHNPKGVVFGGGGEGGSEAARHGGGGCTAHGWLDRGKARGGDS